MSGIRGKNTKPELLIRQGLRKAGIGYRLHGKLPGKPDLVFAGRKAVVFVHGCYWHGHDCHLFRMPGTRAEFWREKIDGNVARDIENIDQLHALGWRVGVVWECSLRGRDRLPFEEVMFRLGDWLDSGQTDLTIRGVQKNAEEDPRAVP